MRTIAVVGSKKTGKTTIIEALTKELTRRGYKVATVKHIPEPDFTIDKKGKDTWRFAQSGARTIIGISSEEIATIEKTNTKGIQLNDILKRCAGNDVVVIEGFRKLVARDKGVFKIAIAKSLEEAHAAAKDFAPILAFATFFSVKNLKLNAPSVDVLKNPEEIVDLVEKSIRKKRS